MPVAAAYAVFHTHQLLLVEPQAKGPQSCLYIPQELCSYHETEPLGLDAKVFVLSNIHSYVELYLSLVLSHLFPEDVSLLFLLSLVMKRTVRHISDDLWKG